MRKDIALNEIVNHQREEPVGVNSYTSVFPISQAIPVSNLRSLSSLVFILLTFKIFNLFNSDYNF